MFRLVAAASALLLSTPAFSWNFVTHRVIAGIAYDRLNPATRTRVDALIRKHPDYERLFLKDAPADEPARSRSAFIEAATWADQIRNDARFYDDARAGAQPTPLLPGFPDMRKHSAWHFVDLSFSQDGTALEPIPEPNLVTEMTRMIADFSRPGLSEPQRAYELVWLLHLFGDVHAPLHCVARDSAEHPSGDQGGNLVYVIAEGSTQAVTLHKYWDDSVGPSDSTPAWVASTIQEIEHRYPVASSRTKPPGTDPSELARESLTVAESQIYTFGKADGTQEHPISVTATYRSNARKVGEEQALKAAERMVIFLDQSIR